MHVLIHWVFPTLQQATTDPRLHWRLLDTHRQVWVSPLQGHCSFLLGSGAQGSVCALQVYFQVLCKFWQLCGGINDDPLPEGLCHTRVCCTQSPVALTVTDPYIHRRCSNTVLSQSLWVPWVLVYKRFVWALWASLVGMGFDSKCKFAPPTTLLGLLLCPLRLGISSNPLQCLPSYWGFSDLGRGVSPHGCSTLL